MKVYNDVLIPSDLNIKGQSLCIGFFDGIHLGHKYLIEEMKKSNNKCSILTFSTNLKGSKLILTEYEKEKKLSIFDIEKMFIIDFNENTKNINKDEFCKFLIDNEIKDIYVGKDFTFGKNKSGNVNDLLKIKDINIHALDLLTSDGIKISSSNIRNLIEEGNIKKANELLGYNYFYSSNVTSGFGRGKKIGFNTINLVINENKVLPKVGVYKTYTIINNKKYLSMTNIGNNPTFNNINLSIENHIINEDIKLKINYVTIEFISFIRDEIKFNNPKELTKQLILDKKYVLNN